MSSLTSPRNTVTVGPQLFGTSQPLATSATAVEGCLVMLNGAGKAVDGYKASGLTCAGIAEASVDQSKGDVNAVCLTGRFLLDSGTSSDAVTQADVGATVYALDNHTVSRLSSGASAVGVCVEIDASGQIVVRIPDSLG